MGDTVISLPCFHAVRQAYPLAEITLLTNFPISSKAAPMFGLLGVYSGIIDDAFKYTLGLRNPFEAMLLILRLRGLGAKTLIYMRSQPTASMILRDQLFFRFAGFRHILCVPRNNDQRLSRVDPKTHDVEAEASRLARCFAHFGPINLNDPANWDLCLSEVELLEGKRLAAMLPSPFLVINTGGKVAVKDWGYAKWAEFLMHFRICSNALGLAIVGAHDDGERADALSLIWGHGAVNFCGGPTPREVASFLLNAHMFVGHDSGPLHLCQCSRTPAIGLFGSYNKPKQWYPLGAHVRVIHEESGIELISVDQVLTQALEVWNGAE